MEKKPSKLRMLIEKSPLVVLLILSTIIMSIFGLYGMASGRYDWNISVEHPALAAFLGGEDKKPGGNPSNVGPIEEFTTPALVVDDSTDDNQSTDEVDTTEPEDTQVDDTTGDGQKETDEPDKETETEPVKPAGSPTQYVAREPSEPRSMYYDDTGVMALTTNYPYKTVDESYFSDALFIGDSRMEGLCYFGGMSTGTYCFKRGVNIWDIMKAELEYNRDGKCYLNDVLSTQTFSKIYIMIGVNELGDGTSQTFAEEYENVINKIKEKQPGAIIYIFGIMNVSKAYSDKDDIYNNDNINSRNCRIAALANGIDVFYLDVNPAVADSTGALNGDYTNDGLHLRAEYYKLWVQFTEEHAV